MARVSTECGRVMLAKILMMAEHWNMVVDKAELEQDSGIYWVILIVKDDIRDGTYDFIMNGSEYKLKPWVDV